MLIVVGSEPEMRLPENVRLQIQDATEILVDEVSRDDFRNACLYGQVISNWNEQLLARNSFAGGYCDWCKISVSFEDSDRTPAESGGSTRRWFPPFLRG
jgi:hypothetical protein